MGSRVKNFLYNHKSPEAVIRSQLKEDELGEQMTMVISADGETANSEFRAFREEVLAEAGEVLDLYFSPDTYLEVVLKGVNKGCALKKV